MSDVSGSNIIKAEKVASEEKLPARKVAGETQKWPASLEWKFRALTQAVFIARSPGLALFSS